MTIDGIYDAVFINDAGPIHCLHICDTRLLPVTLDHAVVYESLFNNFRRRRRSFRRRIAYSLASIRLNRFSTQLAV